MGVWEGDTDCSTSPDTGQLSGHASPRVRFRQRLSGTTAMAHTMICYTMTSTSNALRISLFASALSSALPTLAQQDPITLPNVVVTASRLETRTDALISDVTVISSVELEQQSGRTLTEIISKTAGIQMAASGGRGNTSTLFVRGTEGRHVLLLVDGIRMGSATLGTPSFDNIALDSIERIEVLKGPASALYGSDAVGGVVQIITKKGTKSFAANAKTSIGNGGYKTASAGLSGSADGVRYAVGVGGQSENGYSATNQKVPFDSFHPDKDSYRQTNAYANLTLDVMNGWVIDTRLSSAKGVGHWDNGLTDENPTTQLNNQVLSLGLKGHITPQWTLQLRFGQANDNLSTHSGWGDDDYDTKNILWSWTNEVTTPIGTVLAGWERQKDSIQSTTLYNQTQRSITAGFLGLTGYHNGHSWQANVRRDNNSQFGSATTGLVGYGYKLNPNWRLHASYGTSFKAPSFNQLYYPDFGNATVQPEKGTNKEIGLTYNRGRHEVKLTRFHNRVQGFITDRPIVANIPYARMTGWTIGYQSDWGNTSLHASLDFLNASNVSTNAWLQRRARQYFSLGSETSLGAWTFGGDILALSKRFDDTANTVQMAGFATADVYANYRFHPEWMLQGKINNLSNKHYELASGYNQAGRTALLTLRYQPK